MNTSKTRSLQTNLNTSLEEHSRSARNKLNKKLFNTYSSVVGEVYDLSPSEYRNTALWKTIRDWVRRRDKNTCQTCEIKHRHLDIHHRDYERETLEGFNEGSLITLCRKCHDKVEYFEPQKINKRECELQKEAVLKEMLTKYEAKKAAKEAWISLVESFKEQIKFELNVNNSRGVTVVEIEAFIDNVEIDLYTCFCDIFRYFEKNSNETLRTKYHLSTNDFFAAKAGRKPLNLIDISTSKNVISFNMASAKHVVIKATKHYNFNAKELSINFMNEFQNTKGLTNIFSPKKS